jgi:hypothetical protein
LLIDTTGTAHPRGPSNPGQCHVNFAERCHLYIAVTPRCRISAYSGKLFQMFVKSSTEPSKCLCAVTLKTSSTKSDLAREYYLGTRLLVSRLVAQDLGVAKV